MGPPPHALHATAGAEPQAAAGGHPLPDPEPGARQLHAVTAAETACPTAQVHELLPGHELWPQIRWPRAARLLAPLITPILGSLEGRSWSRMRLIADLVVTCIASALAVGADASLRTENANLWLAASFALLLVCLLRIRRLGDEGLAGSVIQTVARMSSLVSLAAVMTLAADSAVGGPHAVRLALRLCLFSATLLAVEQTATMWLRCYARRIGLNFTPTLIVGAGLVGEHLVRRLSDPRYGLRPVGFLDADPLPRPEGWQTPAVPVLGGPDDLAEALAQTSARQVILAFSTEPDYILVEKVRECEQLGVQVSLVPRLYELINERVNLDHVGGLPLLSLRPTNPRGWQFLVKHLIDRMVALVMLVVLAPVLLSCALAVRLTSPGPVFFRQRRVGRDGHEFDLLKFRTMRQPDPATGGFVPATGLAPGGVEGTDRRTPVGRWLREASIDELPQLINVLRGDMSLVGPRPERPEYVKLFSSEVNRYEDRHRVKSGITGWAQVHGLRGQTSIADRVEWDTYYIKNWSLALDLRILALTAVEVMRLRG